MARSWRWSALGLPVAILMALAVLTVSITAPVVSAQGDAPHPAHIHQNTCEELGDIVVPLDIISFPESANVAGSVAAVPVKVSETEVELTLDDILGATHSINVHRSADAIQDYIACGDIGGPVRGGELVIGLREINDSGHSGVAILEETDAGTTVTVYLIEEAGVGAEEPAAPADDDEAAAEDDEAATVEADDAAETAEPEEEATVEAADEATAEPEDEATVEPEADGEADEAATAAAADDEDAAEDEDAAAADEAVPAGEEVPVDIRDFAYNPNPVEIAVGDTITWTNLDAVPHTATATDRDVLQSGTIAPGGTFSQTFEEAGTIEYFCEFHPNMNGTIIVQ